MVPSRAQPCTEGQLVPSPRRTVRQDLPQTQRVCPGTATLTGRSDRGGQPAVQKERATAQRWSLPGTCQALASIRKGRDWQSP